MRKDRPPNVMIINCHADNIHCMGTLAPSPLAAAPVLLASRRQFGRSPNKYIYILVGE